MDTTILQNECEEIQYILNDTEFVLEPSDVPTEDTDDILYTDGSQTYLVNSYFMNESEKTLVLEKGEDITQLFINNGSGKYSGAKKIINVGPSPYNTPANTFPGQILVAGDQHSTQNQFINDSEFVQYVVEEENNSQILYLSEDSITIESEELSQQQSNHQPVNTIDQTQIIELEELFQQSEHLSSQQGYQYAILKDGKLQIQSIEDESTVFQMSPDKVSDSSLITGKNLITGQTVSLESYIKKRQSGSVEPSIVKSGSKSRKAKLGSLLNRTFRLGARVNGKQLVGKVVQVTTNTERGNCLQKNFAFTEKNESFADSAGRPKSKPRTSYEQLTRNPHLRTVDNDSEMFRHLVRTLSSVLDVENIEEKLSRKKLFIMVEEEKMRADKSSRRVYYAGGSLRPEGVEKWNFVADFLAKDNGGGGNKGQVSLKRLFSHGKFPDAVKLRLTITHEKNIGTRIGVMLECEDDLQTAQEPSTTQNACDLCGENFENPGMLREHRQWHLLVGRGDVFPCRFVGCDRYFGTEALMSRHFQTHEADHSSQDDRLKAFAGLRNLAKKNHNPGKIFGCDMCGRTFSRCSNLQRHMTVHHKGSGDTFQCKICGCSYHFVSSLTRHMVQNHIIGQKTT